MTNYLAFWWNLIVTMASDKLFLACVGCLPLQLMCVVVAGCCDGKRSDHLMLCAFFIWPLWFLLITIPYIGGAFTQ